MIYQILDRANSNIVWVCPDQSTINTAISYGYVEGFNQNVNKFIIGTATDANNILQYAQSSWYKERGNTISIKRGTEIDNVIWWSSTTHDLDNEVPEANTIYRVFDPISVTYFDNTQDLNTAKNDLENAKNNFLNFYGLNSVIVLETIPELLVSKLKSNTTTGTQTL